MYKLMLCWRYLWTRYLALASIISVMLGVGTLVVVNSVMSGFSTKLLNRFRGLQSDIVVKYRSFYGFTNLSEEMKRVRQQLGPRLKEIAPVIESFAMAEYRFKRSQNVIKKPVKVIGIDPASRAATSDFAKWLISQENKAEPEKCFELRGKALDDFKRFRPQDPWQQPHLPSGMLTPVANASVPQIIQAQGQDNKQLPVPPPILKAPDLPPARMMTAVVGWGLASYRKPRTAKAMEDGKPDEDEMILYPGDTMKLMLATRDDIVGIDGASRMAMPQLAEFVVSDLFRSDMSVIDTMVVFVPLEDLQQLQVMQNRATQLEIKLNDYDRDVEGVMRELYEMFPDFLFEVKTWKEIGGPVISAIAVERAILNVLLFLIIAVAGFGILAIFYMIVVEKTRDIGILKSLGASNWGVMGIFVSYGLLLGIVGSGLGTLGGVLFTENINPIEKFISKMTGQEVFPRDIYFFDKIPVELNPWMLLWVNAGAIAIATAASVLPAMRAAMLHPVRALRFE